MTVFLGSWITTIFDPAKGAGMGWLSVAAGFIIVVILTIWNWDINPEPGSDSVRIKRQERKKEANDIYPNHHC